ncbi:hypothetical protein J2Y69_003204 [Microbacterium resistens]|uniref:N-acetyltransferase domain-containing protein n=1 Tax=Microbacterium resistens TaxID=156977 RepID=A0ABU1SG51_9MICO|nr:hypothetical protein [Microbacterium resistens]MDR6868585.1 hypothetical protein [Microbacterium resistens]
MKSEVAWLEPPMVRGRFGWGPEFVDDDRFTHEWWLENGDFGPPAHQWRSYVRGGEEVARALLSLQYVSHSPATSRQAMLIWNFEIREDLRCTGEHLGTTIIEQLAEEYHDREIYIGSAPDAMGFWTKFGWPLCDCDDCRSRHMIVRCPHE